MISDKKHIQQLAALLLKKGVKDVVISPGSRNAPLINTLTGTEGFYCLNIVDERSAAYFALGLAQAKKKPVALVCSSGTAPLNYAPAVAEAFYLNVPLIVLTADRPDYWIDQNEAQCIPQKNIYTDFIKAEISLPLSESETELWHAGRMINETLNKASSENSGPVHINIPLEEPLHNIVDKPLPEVKLIDQTDIYFGLNEKKLDVLAENLNKSDKVLILAGQSDLEGKLNNLLSEFSEKIGAVVLKEHLSNLGHLSFCSNIDTIMPTLLDDTVEDFRPDLLISFGGQFVSKSLKQFLRKNRPENHWHLSLNGDYYDTYQSLTSVIKMEAVDFFEIINSKVNPKENRYLQLWKDREVEVVQKRNNYIQELEFCDLKVFDLLRQTVPGQSVIHLGNSTPVRYALICDQVKNTTYFGNRGTSGIDGCLSTAVGYASASEKINTVILGDLSFFYDSNALWNKYLGNNLRVIVINNGGGNIFGLIKGPEKSPVFEEHFLAVNDLKAKGLARTFGLDYFKAENEDELTRSLAKFYSEEQNKPALLEIFTNAEVNTKTFRELFKQVKA